MVWFVLDCLWHCFFTVQLCERCCRLFPVFGAEFKSFPFLLITFFPWLLLWTIVLNSDGMSGGNGCSCRMCPVWFKPAATIFICRDVDDVFILCCSAVFSHVLWHIIVKVTLLQHLVFYTEHTQNTHTIILMLWLSLCLMSDQHGGRMGIYCKQRNNQVSRELTSILDMFSMWRSGGWGCSKSDFHTGDWSLCPVTDLKFIHHNHSFSP